MPYKSSIYHISQVIFFLVWLVAKIQSLVVKNNKFIDRDDRLGQHQNLQYIKCNMAELLTDVSVMAIKNHAKFEELTCQFKIDMRNLMNSDLGT